MSTIRRRRPSRLVSATAAMALVLGACASGDSDSAAGTVASPADTATTADRGSAAPGTPAPTGDSATAPSADSTPAPTPNTEGDTAPAPTDGVVVPELLQFTAPLVGGGTFDGAEVAGVPTAFWFWAPT